MCRNREVRRYYFFKKKFIDAFCLILPLSDS
jgi:hypothetical protein